MIPTPRLDDLARGAPILHKVQISLGDILDGRNAAGRQAAGEPRKRSLLLLGGHGRIPERRIDVPGLDGIGPDGGQVQGEVPREPLQPRREVRDQRPAGRRLVGDAARRDGQAGLVRARQVARRQLPQDQRHVQPQVRGLPDLRQREVREPADG